MKNDLRRSIASPLATVALCLIPCLAWSAPPEATAYQMTVDHAGVTTSGGVLALQETPAWTATLFGASSFPIIAGGRVFVTSAGVPGGNYGTQLHAFDAQTGATLWGPLTLSGTYYWSGLTYDAGTLFVVNFDGLLRSYDAATGAAGWSVQLPVQYAFSSPPTASNGIVYVGGAGSGGTLYAVNETNGQVLWTASVSNGDNSSPAVGPSGVYVSYVCPHDYAFQLTSSSSTGQLIWQYAPNNCSGGGGKTPVYANGKVYARDDISNPVILDALNGTLLGNFAYGPVPAIGSTTGFFLSSTGLSATDLATSTVLWNFTGDSGLVSAPIVVDDTVIVGSSSGTLFGLNTQTGHVTWQVATGASVPAPDEQNVSQPLTGLAIADGILVVPAGSSLLAYKIFGPPAPMGVTATGGAGAVNLSWAAAAGAATYNIYMGASAGAEDVAPVKTGVTGTSTTVTNLTPGTTYFFTVKAVGSAGISAPSNEAFAAPHNPASPSALSATAVVGGVTLSWAASSEAISYNVYMGTSAGAESTTPITSVTTTGTTLTGLTPGVTYYFTVKAVSYGASSSPSNEAFAVAALAPPPAGVTATAQIGSVTLNWSAAAGATSYNVYSGTTAGGESATPVVSGTTSTSAAINAVTANTTYYFVIRSVVSGVPGAASTEVSATVLPTPAPAGLTATAGPGQAALSWTASATATSYNVYSCSGATTLGGLTSTSATVTGLTPGVQYCFVVEAQGAAGLSAASNQATVTPTLYAAPTNLVAVPAVGQVTLTWAASPAAILYHVYMGTGAGLEGAIPVSTVPGTSATVSGLTNSFIYYFFIEADTPIGSSLPSKEVSAAPLTPPAPTNLSAVSGPGQIVLGWSASVGASSYQVYMGTAAGGEASTPVQTGITGLGTVVTGLNSGTAYYFVVRALTPSGLSYASNEASATPAPLLVPPPAPAGLTAVAGANQVILSWSASVRAAGYDIYMGTSSGGEGSTPVMTGVQGVTATIAGLTNGTTYFYVVKASNASGSSPASNEVSAKPVAPPPPGPANLSAVAGSGQVTLSWAASAGATSYSVYMGTSAGGESSTAAQTGITALNTTITGLTNGTTYYYTVKAVDANGTSAASNEASAKPAAPLPPAPTNLSAVAASGQVTLSWAAAAGAANYSVYMGTGAGGESSTAAQTGITGLSTTITGLTNGTTYFFLVKATNAAGSSAASNEASARPAAPPPPAPANLSAVAASGQVNLSWTASAGATSYSVYMGTSAGGESSTPAQIGITGLSTTINGVTNGTTYYYSVKAVDTDGGTSAASNEVSATPTAPPTPAPPTQSSGGGGGGGGAFDVISLLLLTAVAAMSSRFRGAIGGTRRVMSPTGPALSPAENPRAP